MQNSPQAAINTPNQVIATRSRRAARFAAATLVGIILYVVLDIIAQLLPPHYNPISQAESDLAVGSFGWIMTLNFVIRGLLTLCLIVGLASAVPPPARSRTGTFLLAIWAIGAFLLAAYPTDVGARHTLHGLIHLLVALVAFVAGAVGELLISLRLAADPRWAAVRPFLLTTAIAALVLLLLVLGSAAPISQSIFGLTERIFLGLILLWIGVVSWYVFRQSASFSQ